MTRFSSMTVVTAVAMAVLVAAASAAPQRGNNAAAIGNSNINGLLQDRQLVMTQINCLKGVAGCNRLGQQLKQAIPEVLNNKCARCTPTQVANARKLIDYVRANYPQDYKVITDKYAGRSG